MRLANLFLAATLATIPIQLSKFFWPEFSFVLGIPIDLLAPSIYLSDLALFAYLLFFLLENRRHLAQIFKGREFLAVGLFIFNLYLFLNALLISDSAPASLIFSARTLLLGLFVLFAQVTLKDMPFKNLALSILGFSAVWQSALLALEFIFQRSLGLYFLGERTFDNATVGIAHWQLFGKELLRPYGTFPHPNVAAAFLVITAILKWRLASSILLGPALLLTFSKAAFGGLGLWFVASFKTPKDFVLRAAIASLALFFLIKSAGSVQIAHIGERLTLSGAALQIFAQNPLFGVGANRFIYALAELDLFPIGQVRLLQPVHNVFLLILAENGLVGLLLLIIVLAAIAREITTRQKLILFMVLLVFASVDHFFWTLQQGRLLFWAAMAFIISGRRRQKNV